MEVGWAGSAPHFIYIHYAPPLKTPKFGFVLWSFGVSFACISQCLLSALLFLITTYPELSRSSEMLQQSVLQETWNREHQLSQVFSDPSRNQMNNPRKLDEAGVSLVECCSIPAYTEIVEHTYPASSAGPVEQDPCVPLVQIGQMLDSSTLLRQFLRNTCRHIHVKTVIYSQPVHHFLHLAILETSGGPVTVEGDQAVFSEIMQITNFSSPQIMDRRRGGNC